MGGSIIIVDDDLDTASVISEMLRRRGFLAHHASSGDECLAMLDEHQADVVVTDVMMPGMSGIELCEILRLRAPRVLTIILTARSGVETAMAAMTAGAFDYLCKPVPIAALALALTRAVAHAELQQEADLLRSNAEWPAIDDLVGDSETMRATLALVARVARVDTSALFVGETGTGKSLVARAVHEASSRRAQPVVAIDCSMVEATFLERELFGSGSRPGAFAATRGGTVLLREIGAASLHVQQCIAEALRTRVVRDHRVTVRIVASTSRDLEAAVARGQFDAELLALLADTVVRVPPLRERGLDVLVLARRCLQRAAMRLGKPASGLTPRTANVLLAYDWPGNVRELCDCIEHAVAHSLHEITVDDLPVAVRAGASSLVLGDNPCSFMRLDEMDRRYVRQVIAATRGDEHRAAQLLGIGALHETASASDPK